jgi:hypothetical protein
MARRWPLVLVAASVLAWPAAAAPAAHAVAPALRVRTYDPFSVRGTAFHKLERVKLKLDGTWTVRVKADAHGRFVAVFRGVAADVCDGVVVKATGSKGSRALLRILPRECPSRSPG